MIPVLDSDGMRALDRRATEEFGIPSILLMENAALAVCDVAMDRFPEAGRVAIFCGEGNNGGDGFAAARHLRNRGLDVALYLVGRRDRVRGDAAANLTICEKSGIAPLAIESGDDLHAALDDAESSDLVIDAVFGTGLDRPIEGFRAAVIEALNAMEVPILSVDVPSGLDASRSALIGPAIQATVTVTFAAPKVAHVLDPAASLCGMVVVADISIPAIGLHSQTPALLLVSGEDVAALLPPRPAESHKGTWGHVAIVGGSAGRSGAAVLAARGALRTGAGLVTVLTDAETAAIVDAHTAESMTLPITRDDAGRGGVLEALRGKSVAVIGPGLPDDEQGYRFVRTLLAAVPLPTVVDASALNAFPGRLADLRSERPRVLTPHPGELARLAGVSTEAILADRVTAAREAAKASACVVVLKGHQTLIASPDGRVAVNPTGNPGMATGGTGDVLSGIIATLLGQSGDPFLAACAGTWLHGAAGDVVAARAGEVGLTALDLAESIPAAISEAREGA